MTVKEALKEYRANLNDPVKKADYWHKYKTVLYKEKGDYQIFFNLSREAREAGHTIARQYIDKVITAKEFYTEIQTDCAGKYMEMLIKYELVPARATYEDISTKVAIEALQALKSVDSEIKICIAKAKIWFRWQELIHAKYNLPTIAEMKYILSPESEDERGVIKGNLFETTMTDKEKTDWEKLCQ